MANNINPQAYVNPNAQIGQNVTIYPFAYIEDDVVIGDNCVIYPFSSIMAGTRMGSNNTVHQGTVLGALPQDFDFSGEKTELVIGNNNVIRENVVINRATHTGGQTIIENDNFIMEGVHISHDAHIYNGCVIGYGTKIAGCIELFDGAILSSNVIANPGVRIGKNAMVQSGCRFSQDIPPYIVASGTPIEYSGVNATILNNAGIEEKTQKHIAQAYRLIFNGKTSLFDATNQILDQVPESAEREEILQFLKETKLGIINKPL